MGEAISSWAAKVLQRPTTSLKQAAWACGCAKKGSEEEQRLFLVVEREWGPRRG